MSETNRIVNKETLTIKSLKCYIDDAQQLEQNKDEFVTQSKIVAFH